MYELHPIHSFLPVSFLLPKPEPISVYGYSSCLIVSGLTSGIEGADLVRPAPSQRPWRWWDHWRTAIAVREHQQALHGILNYVA